MKPPAFTLEIYSVEIIDGSMTHRAASFESARLFLWSIWPELVVYEMCQGYWTVWKDQSARDLDGPGGISRIAAVIQREKFQPLGGAN